MTVFRARQAMGRAVQGIALVAQDGFSARYDLDRVAGVFSRPAHKLAGQSYVGKVRVLDTAKGGVATAWMLRDMKQRGLCPKALLLNAANPIMVQGAAFAGLSLIDRFKIDVTQAIATGDFVSVDPANGVVSVRKPQII